MCIHSVFLWQSPQPCHYRDYDHTTSHHITTTDDNNNEEWRQGQGRMRTREDEDKGWWGQETTRMRDDGNEGGQQQRLESRVKTRQAPDKCKFKLFSLYFTSLTTIHKFTMRRRQENRQTMAGDTTGARDVSSPCICKFSNIYLQVINTTTTRKQPNKGRIQCRGSRRVEPCI